MFSGELFSPCFSVLSHLEYGDFLISATLSIRGSEKKKNKKEKRAQLVRLATNYYLSTWRSKINFEKSKYASPEDVKIVQGYEPLHS